jgi:GAF domain-containing protein
MIARYRAFLARLAQLYPDPVDFFRVKVLVYSSGITALLVIAVVVLQILANSRQAFANSLFTIALAVVLAGGTLMLPIVLVGIGQAFWGRLLFVSGIFLLGVMSLATNGIFSFAVMNLILAIALASVLFGRVGTLLSGALAFGLFLLFVLLEAAGVSLPHLPTASVALTAAGNLLSIVFILALISYLLWVTTGEMQLGLVSMTRSTNQLHNVTEIGLAASAGMKDENLYAYLVELIQKRMGFYHVQIFLLDEARANADLVASTGDAGKRLMARGHRLAVGSRSVVGQVARRGEMVYVVNTGSDPLHRPNDLLPDTRSELALPLRDGEQVFGIIDVQSTRPDAFSQDDIETLGIMASQLGAAIRNAQVYQTISTQLVTSQRQAQESQVTLREVEQLIRHLTGQAWEDFLSTSGREYGVQVSESGLERGIGWSPLLTQAYQANESVLHTNGDTPLLAVPLDVRGQVLGAIEVALPPGVDHEDARELIEAVSVRLALALDNSRLFEEAQSLADQEHVINEIGGRLQTLTQVDDMLRLTLTELGAALGADRAAIRLRATPAGAASGNDSMA